MNVHEYQAKEIFKSYGIPINKAEVAKTADEAFEVAKRIGGEGTVFAVKAQVHAGGRGKGGGIKIVKTPEEVRTESEKIIGMTLVTPQTGPEGRPVDVVLIEATSPIKDEYYASIVLDRVTADPCLIVSAAGGMDIEAVAEETPEKILKQHFSADDGLSFDVALEVAKKVVDDDGHAKAFAETFVAMSKIFLEKDCSLIEINPLSVMENGSVIAIDAKINFDDNALFRQPEIAKMRDEKQEDSREVEARQFDLSYVGLNGNIGCIVNGAGLAMATLDIITYAGGEPANFLDVGGGASKEKVAAAFKIILRDPHVKAILVNIFGGIMRCDIVAEGILAAVDEIGVKVPLIVRLEGTNVKEGKELLEKSSLNIISANGFAEAAEKAVAAVS